MGGGHKPDASRGGVIGFPPAGEAAVACLSEKEAGDDCEVQVTV
jgi:hypothetical protein